MSNEIYNYNDTENEKNPCYIPIRSKFISKKFKRKISPLNNKLMNNKGDAHSQKLLNNENIDLNDISKYVRCKRHPQNIIRYFCENDKTFNCTLCISQHDNHSYKNFICTKKYFDKEIIAIKKLFEEKEMKYFEIKKKAEIFFSKIKIHFDQEIHKINDYFDSIISILQAKKSEFISKMLIIYENYLKQFIKYKFIFDHCDKDYYNLNQKIKFIDNEVYKKEDLESFYKIKNCFIKEVKDFSKYNEEYFHDDNIFIFNSNSMPIYVYPEKSIINNNDSINLFGYFKNTNICCNIEGNDTMLKNIIDKKRDENGLFDSIYQDSLNNKNINSIIKNKANLEIFLEKNKNKNILSSINSGMSNTNESFINKQLVDTDSTLFFFNKNGVKNVFKQQEIDLSQKFDKNEIQLNNNKEIKISNSPKIKDNNINKVRYTSYNKENRNKQIIKKFLENKDLNSKGHFGEEIKLSKEKNNIDIYSNSKHLTTYENGDIKNTLNEEYFNLHKNIQLKINKMKKNKKISKNKKQNYPPNNGLKKRQFIKKRAGSLNKKINDSKKELNIHSLNFNLIKNDSKNKIILSNKKKIKNINIYFDDSIEVKNQKSNKINNIIYSQRRTEFSKKRKMSNSNLIRNHRNIRSMKNILKNKLNNNDNSVFQDNIIPNSQISRMSENYQRRDNFSNFNRSNSYKYFDS